MDMVAIGHVVLTSREHIIGLEPLGKGLMVTLLRYPYEVRDEKEYFDEIQDVKVTKDMLDLAKHIVNQKAAHFEPERLEDHYEEALSTRRAAAELLQRNRDRAAGQKKMLLPIEGKKPAVKKSAKPERATGCRGTGT